jgi:hypothetical protein
MKKPCEEGKNTATSFGRFDLLFAQVESRFA